MRTLREFDVKNKRVLVRCDFQVPLDKKGNILDDFKIKATLPTIKYLMTKRSKVILMSHWKPMESGKKAESLRLISPVIEALLGRKIKFIDDCVGEKVEKEITKIQAGEIALLENLRRRPEEEANDDNFARRLARLGDIYINDAFGVSHRFHASLVSIPKYLPHGAGLLLIKEIQSLKKIRENPKKPLIAIIGGAKVETKTGAINELSKNADFILVGDLISCEIKEKNIEFKNPQKIIFPQNLNNSFDISWQTVDLFRQKIKKAKTVFWTGPLGKIEENEFQKGTLAIALAIIKSGAFSVVGGGETVWFLGKSGLLDKFSHVSTGGGAMLEFLSGKELPGIEALSR